jgi:hypothetical protein
VQGEGAGWGAGGVSGPSRQPGSGLASQRRTRHEARGVWSSHAAAGRGQGEGQGGGGERRTSVESSTFAGAGAGICSARPARSAAALTTARSSAPAGSPTSAAATKDRSAWPTGAAVLTSVKKMVASPLCSALRWRWRVKDGGGSGVQRGGVVVQLRRLRRFGPVRAGKGSADSRDA